MGKEIFEGTKDVRAFVTGAANGRVLSGASLADIATTAAACTRIHAHINNSNTMNDGGGDGSGDGSGDGDDAMAPLKALATPLASIPGALEPEIRRCIAIPGGGVMDAASPALAAVRAERRAVSKQLQALLIKMVGRCRLTPGFRI